MRKIKLFAIPSLVILALVLAAVNPGMVRAADDEPIEIEFTGTVTEIDLDGGTLTVEVDNGEGSLSYLVYPPDDFDWLVEVEIGDTVEVEGILQDDGSVLATRIVVERDDDDDDGDDEDDGEGNRGYFCRNLDDPDIVHPVGGAIAARYDVDYEEIMGWFCEEHMGFGQIMLALQTVGDDGEETYEDFLNRRLAGEGWGQIWQDLGLIGRPKDADPPEEEDADDPSSGLQNQGVIRQTGRPDHLAVDKTTGKPDQAGGPPSKPGKPDQPGGPPSNPGKPDQAGGPPSKPGKPDQAGGPSNAPGKPDQAGGPPSKPGKPDQAGGPPNAPGKPDQAGGPPSKPGKP